MMEYNDFNTDLDIKERAIELIEESGMLKYVDKERVEQLFSNIHILETNNTRDVKRVVNKSE